MSTIEWEYNASTGHDISRVTKNGRILRMRFNDGSFLYWAEFWGDYSLQYPKRGSNRESYEGARKDLIKIEKHR